MSEIKENSGCGCGHDHDHDHDEVVEVVTFVDDEGNEFEMEIVDEFDHKDKNYAVLIEVRDEENGDEEENLYIFEVNKIEDSEEEEFQPIEDDALMDELIVVVESRLFDEED